MNQTNRLSYLLIGLCALLGLVAIWSWGRSDSARTDALAAGEDLSACKNMAKVIEDARRRPDLAGDEEMQLSELARHVEEAAKAAAIPPSAVTRIWPDQARRLGDGPYKEMPTQITLKKVTMQQAVTFLYSLSSASRGLWPKSLRLTAPRETEDQTWSLETTVSYLIYSPTNATGAGVRDKGF